MAEKNYNVAFEYTESQGGYAGVRTWCSFKNETDFNKWYDSNAQERQRVLEKGISNERAIELTKQTPIECYLKSCIQEATNEKTGEISEPMLEMKLAGVLACKGMPMSLLLTNAKIVSLEILAGIPVKDITNSIQADLNVYESLGILEENL